MHAVSSAEGAVQQGCRARAGLAAGILRFVSTHRGIAGALAFALLLHARTLGYFFNGDDFVVLGNIEWSGSRAFLLDTLRLEDYIPSWRPLSAAVYTLEWRLFGLNAMPWRVLALALHLTSRSRAAAMIWSMMSICSMASGIAPRTFCRKC